MQQSNNRRGDTRCERGQATIAMVGVLVLVGLSVVAVSTLAGAMVHRARARTAADAVALAAAADPAVAAEVGSYYRGQGITFDQVGPHAIARSGPSRAEAWATLSEAPDQPAPVLVAIVARAEQLTGGPFHHLRWHRMSVEVVAADATRLEAVAAELGLCEVFDTSSGLSWRTFARC